MEQESDNCGGRTTSTAAIEEERMEESDNCGEEFYSCGEDSQSSSSSCDSPWNFPHPPEYYGEWDGRHVMEWNEITYSDPSSSASSSFTSLSRSTSMIEKLDDSIKELSLELKKLLKAKDIVQSKLKKKREKHPVAMTVIDDVQSWFIHVDKSIKSGNILLRSKFPMKLVFWSKQQRNRDAYDAYQEKKVILELIETFLNLKNQAQDLLDRIARHPIEEELWQLKVQTSYFSLKEIEVATENFNPEKKISEGRFDPIYKGVLQDGTIVAVKRVSPISFQGSHSRFVNEIVMLSTLQHPNIVKLLGCCIEGSELLIIYEYLENISLHRALFGKKSSNLELNWQRRRKISFDIARGLAYLHEESRLKIVHRCIAPAYVLLDKHLDAKISGFGFATFDGNIDEENNLLVGVIGYLAHEYAMRGHLTQKADVYSYGVVLLEIVSGKRCTSHNPKYDPEEDFVHLHWARALKDQGNLLDLVDPSLGSSFSITEAEQMLNLALRCTNDDPTLRPTMSSVMSMIEELIDLATSMDRFDS